jgi:hypothetical protein
MNEEEVKERATTFADQTIWTFPTVSFDREYLIAMFIESINNAKK